MRDENDSLAPIEKYGLPHFHDDGKRVNKLLRIIIFYEFADDDSFQRFMGYFYR